MRNRRGYNLVELIVVVLILGILAYIAIPRVQLAAIHRKEADTTARKIVTDLRRARRFAISDANNNTSGFALNMTGASPYSAYEIVNLKTSETVDTLTIDPDVNCTGGSTFEFGPLGNLKSGSDTQVTVSAEGKSFTIDIVSGTGAVKCTEN